MTNLLLSISAVVLVYFMLVLVINKRMIAWRYKALIYWLLTFVMLVSAFLAFDYYVNHWQGDPYQHSRGSAGRSSE